MADQPNYTRRNLRATAVGFLVVMINQGCTVPLFSHYLDFPRFGEWLVLAAIPNYLSLSDLGLSAATAVRLTQARRSATPNSNYYASAFRAGWISVTAASGLLLLVVVGTIEIVSPVRVFGLKLIGEQESRLVLAILALNVFLILQCSVFEAGMRGAGHAPRGVAFLSAGRLAEVAGLAIALSLHQTLTSAALGMFLSRAVVTFFFLSALRRTDPLLRIGFQRRDLKEIRASASHGIAFSGLAVGNLVLTEATVIVIGRELGGRAVATFVTVRIVVNVIRQVNNVITLGIQPGLTESLAKQDVHAARRYFKQSLRSTSLVAIISVLALYLFGPWIIGIWASTPSPSPTLVLLMALTVAADTPYLAAMSVAAAANRHRFPAWAYLASALASIILMIMLLPREGLIAVPICMFLIDLVVTPIALVRCRAILQSN